MSALGGIENTSRVLLEVGVTSIDGDADWLFGNGGLELGSRLGLDSSVGNGLNDFLGLGGLASVGSGLVWVG